jgi:predicted nucleic acid-binding protein
MLLSLAEAGLFRPRWSSRILDETQKAITQITKGETDGSRQRAAIEAAFPEALVTGYEIFEDKLALPDPNDNHVLAAAIATSASVIVTDNLADFPSAVLDPHSIQAISADDFIADTIPHALARDIRLGKRAGDRLSEWWWPLALLFSQHHGRVRRLRGQHGPLGVVFLLIRTVRCHQGN